MKKIALSITQYIIIVLLILPTISACTSSTEGLQVGDQAPEFQLATSTGETVALSDYVGSQPVLLYFHMAVG